MRKSLFLIAALAIAGLAHADYTLTVLHTNDLHAHIEPSKVGSTMLGGYAKQATLVKKFRAEDPNTILPNGGDTFQGTLYFNQYTGFADLAIMNAIGYDGMAVGNHEFVLGPGMPNTFAAHRLIWLGEREGCKNEVVDSLFPGYFEEGADIGSIAMLTQLAGPSRIEYGARGALSPE